MFKQHPGKNCSEYSAVKSMLQFSSKSFITQRKPVLLQIQEIA